MEPLCKQRRSPFTLTGLTVLRFVAIGFLASGCYEPERDVRLRILEQLAADSITSGLNLTVKVNMGVATVSGDVTGRAQEQHVLAIVSGTDGVQDVINGLKIDDGVIAARVRQALKSDPLLEGVPVTVLSHDAVVTLRSDRTNAGQRTRMVQIAAGVADVVDVVDDMK